jgi:hypothetical protein
MRINPGNVRQLGDYLENSKPGARDRARFSLPKATPAGMAARYVVYKHRGAIDPAVIEAWVGMVNDLRQFGVSALICHNGAL